MTLNVFLPGCSCIDNRICKRNYNPDEFKKQGSAVHVLPLFSTRYRQIRGDAIYAKYRNVFLSDLNTTIRKDGFTAMKSHIR